MPTAVPLQRLVDLVDLVDPDATVLLILSSAEAAAAVASGDVAVEATLRSVFSRRSDAQLRELR